MRRKAALAILLIFFLIMAAWLFYPVSAIILTDAASGQIIFIKQMTDQDEVTIGWTHSVEQLPWEEIFRVDGDKLIMDRTRFKAFGAGVPSEAPGKNKIENGWVVYYDLQQHMPQLTYGISKRGRHILRHDGGTIALYQGLPDATPVNVSASKLNRIKLWRLERACAKAGILEQLETPTNRKGL